MFVIAFLVLNYSFWASSFRLDLGGPSLLQSDIGIRWPEGVFYLNLQLSGLRLYVIEVFGMGSRNFSSSWAFLLHFIYIMN